MKNIIDKIQEALVKQHATKDTIACKYNYKLIDLGLPSGKLWADRNIGANRPEECGDYYAWGSLTPSTECDVNYRIELGLDIAKTKNDVIYVNSANKLQIPTEKDFDELVKHTTIKFDSTKNVFILKSIKNDKELIFPNSGYYNAEKNAKECVKDIATAFLWKPTRKQDKTAYFFMLTCSTPRYNDEVDTNNYNSCFGYLLSNLRGVTV